VITRDVLAKALDKRGAKLECPVCGKKEWLPMGISGELETLVLMPGVRADTGGIAGVVELDWGYPVAGFYCGNCGFVRLHRLDALRL